MAIVWTKYWGPADDGTVLKGIDLRNIQDDINTTGLADADAIQGFPVDAPTPADDGKALIYDDGAGQFIYGNLSGLPSGLGPLPWPTDTAPAGWVLCYGQAIDRTAFAGLFAVIGTTFGVGDGSTTFNVPDYRGRTPFGKDDMGGVSADVITDTEADTIGGTFGDEEHTLTLAEIPPHTHTYDQPRDEDGGGSGEQEIQEINTGVNTGSAGGGDPHNNLPPGITSNYIIKT